MCLFMLCKSLWGTYNSGRGLRDAFWAEVIQALILTEWGEVKQVKGDMGSGQRKNSCVDAEPWKQELAETGKTGILEWHEAAQTLKKQIVRHEFWNLVAVERLWVVLPFRKNILLLCGWGVGESHGDQSKSTDVKRCEEGSAKSMCSKEAVGLATVWMWRLMQGGGWPGKCELGWPGSSGTISCLESIGGGVVGCGHGHKAWWR